MEDYKKTPPPPYSVDANSPPPPGFYIPPDQDVPPQVYVGEIRVAPVRFGPESQRCVCPHCRQGIQTQIKAEPTGRTHLYALALLCLFWPCMCLPYFMDSCQNQNHYCPNCGAYLGVYEN
ncbi:lipopolysaccharide-induced tumor necrosis factor-alpha factor homolog [Atheta coriaria]|uniref:lipopolysaccharide-induced tumor necrosis factor-alpha factor homolog n=1 Tax=Dalotia coriaria TaxID=877792 RepID=UPI0031F3AE2C